MYTVQVCNGCKSFGDKRCTGCYVTWYCGVVCQKADWATHSATCKRIRSEYAEVKPKVLPNGYITRISELTVHAYSTEARSPHFVLKVQTPREKGSNADMLCYNEKRDVQARKFNNYINLSGCITFAPKINTVLRVLLNIYSGDYEVRLIRTVCKERYQI